MALGKLLKARPSYTTLFFVALLVITVRIVADWGLFSYPIELDELSLAQHYVRFFLENIYYFLIVFVFICLVIARITKERLISVMRFAALCSPVIIIPPLLDALLLGRTAGYTYATKENFFWNLFTLSFVKGDASLGISIEILLALIVIFAYTYWKTKSVWKSLIPVVLADLFLVMISTPELFFPYIEEAPVFGEIEADFVKGYFLPLYYFIPFLVISSVGLGMHQPKKLKAILTNLRPLRGFAFVLAVLFGGIMTKAVDAFSMVFAMIAVFLVWEVSVILNDIYDLPIDRITNRERPLVKGILKIPEYRLVAILLAFAALSFAAIINLVVLGLTALCLLLAYLYSAPPFRFRQNLAGHLVIGASLTLSLFIGIAVSGGIALTLDMIRFTVLVLLYGTFLPLVKDLKDIKGDRRYHVSTLFTIFGKKQAKNTVLVLFFALQNLPTWILGIGMLPLLVFSAATSYTYYKTESIHFVYIIGMALATFTFVKLFLI